MRCCLNKILQSTLPRRERPAVEESPQAIPMISIHAPAKGATCFRIRARTVLSISIHAPAKGATLDRPSPSSDTLYFNPRSREGSDVFPVCGSYRTGTISIHAPAKGATSPPSADRPRENHFNPRSREGSDGIDVYEDAFPAISIHAPAKGATLDYITPSSEVWS